VFFSGLTLDVDATYVVVLALLLIPFVILNGLVFKPFLAVFDERHERVEGALARADKKIEEAEAKAKAFEAKIKTATQKGIEARSAIRGAAQAAVNARVEGERGKLDRKVEAALAEIDATQGAALASVDAEARRLAEVTAAKLLGRGI